MKKIISILTSILVLVLSMTASINALASVTYDADTNTITVNEVGEFKSTRIYEDLPLSADNAVPLVLVFEEGVTSIGEDVMAGCQNLGEVHIPKSVQTVKKGSFSDCDNLKTIYYAGSRSTWKQVRIEAVGNEEFTEASVKYAERDEVNNVPVYIGIGVVILLAVCLTAQAGVKSKKRGN